MTSMLPPELPEGFDLRCHRCGAPADRCVDDAGLARIMAPRSMPLPRSGMTGVAVRMDPSGITSVTAADLVALGLLCGGHEPRPPGQDYDLQRSVAG